MTETAVQRIELPPQAGQVLAVEFHRQGDRYAHRVVVSADDQEQWIAESIEGDGHDLFPPSPALQQLSVQALPGNRQAALLVGMAGKSHYSLSVTAEHDAGKITFDVACNYKQEPSFLGSSYQTSGAAEWLDLVQFSCQSALPTQVVERADGSRALVPTGELAPAPSLGRWCYTLSLQSK